MSNKKKRGRGKKKARPKRSKRQLARQLLKTAGEDQRAEAVTVAWALTIVATLLAQAAALIAWSLGAAEPSETQDINLTALLLFTASIAGLVCLLLLPVTYLVRKTKPPTAVAVFAAAVGLTPWLLRAVL